MPPGADVLDRAFHALSDPTRREMVRRLGSGPASVSDLARPLSMTLAAVVQHVQVLEASGLVRTRKVGRVRTCSLDLEGLRAAERWLVTSRTAWERRLDRLGDVLDEGTPPGRGTHRPHPPEHGRRSP